MGTSVSDYQAPTLPLKKPYFTGCHGIERVKQKTVGNEKKKEDFFL